MSSRFPIWRRQDSGSNAAILENEKTLGTRLPDNHAVHTQTRDHGLYGWSRFPSPAKTWSQLNCELMSVSGLNRSRLNYNWGADQIWWAFRGVYTQFSKSPCLSPPPKQLFIFYTSSLPYCICAGVGPKRLRTATVAKIQRLCLRNLWIAIPRESRRSHVQLTQKGHLFLH